MFKSITDENEIKVQTCSPGTSTSSLIDSSNSPSVSCCSSSHFVPDPSKLRLPSFPSRFVSPVDSTLSVDQRYYLFDTLGELIPLHTLRLSPILDNFQLFRTRCPFDKSAFATLLAKPDGWATLQNMMGSSQHVGGFSFKPTMAFAFDQQAFSNYFNLCVTQHASLIGVQAPYKPIYWIEDLLSMWFGFEPCTLLECWALIRTAIVVIAQDSTTLRKLEERLRFAVAGVYPIYFRPEFGDRFNALRETLSYYKEEMLQDFANIGFFVRSIFHKILETPTLIYNGLSDLIGGLVTAHITKLAIAKAQELRDFLSSNIALCFFKTIIRYALGYEWRQLLLEMLFENSFLVWLDTRVQSCSFQLLNKAFLPIFGMEAQAITDEFLKFVISLVVGGASSQYSHVSRLVSGISQAATALDKFEFGKKMNQLKDYLLDNDPQQQELLRLKKLYPSTVLLIELHQRIVEVQVDRVPTIAETRSLLSFYASHLKESFRFNKIDSDFLRPLLVPASRYVTKLGVSPFENCRREPKHFCFAGPPGLGKSTVVDRLIQVLAKSIKQDLVETAYHVNPSDVYASKYRCQDIWVLDELFQAADSVARPSIDLSLLFKLITKSPIVLNMAAVEEKGTIASCNLLLSCSNVRFAPDQNNTAQLRPYVKSVNSVESVRRRLHYIVFPVLQEAYYLNGGVICHRSDKTPVADADFNHSKLHFYTIIDYNEKALVPPSGRAYFTYAELLYFISKEYTECRNYQPIDTVSDDLQFCYNSDAISDEIPIEYFDNPDADPPPLKQEGFLDYFRRPVIPPASKIVPCCCLSGTVTQKYSRASCDEILGVVRDADTRYVFDCSWDRAVDYDITNRNSAFLSTEVNIRGGIKYYKDRPVIIVDDFLAFLEPGQPSYDTLEVYDPMGPRCIYDSSLNKYFLARFYTYTRYLVSHPHAVPATTGLMTLLAATLGFVVVSGIARLVYDKILESRQRYSVYNGEVHYTAESGEVITDPRLHPDRQITIGGRVWVRRFSRTTNQDEWYPQGLSPENEDSHYSRQVPSICKSLYAISLNGAHVGNGFFVAEGVMLTPTHVAENFQKFDLLQLKADSFVKEVLLRVGSELVFIIEEVAGVADLSVVTFLRSSVGCLNIPNARVHSSKITQNTPDSGQARNFMRDATGRLIVTHCTYALPEGSEGYLVNDTAVTHTQKSCRITTTLSSNGWCGSLYLDATLPSSPIVGMHVAGNANGRGLFVTMDTFKLKVQRLPTSNQIVPACDSSFAGIEVALLDEGIFSPEAKKVPSRFYDQLRPNYAMSKVKPFYHEDRRRDPGYEAFERYRGITLSDNARRMSLLPAAEALALGMKSKYRVIDLPSWEDTVSGGGELCSLDASKSAGWPHAGLKKQFLLYDEDGTILPTEKLIEMCETALIKLAPADFDTREFADFELVPSGVKGCLKEEPLALHKVHVKSRLFGASEIVEFLLQRRFFFDLSWNYTHNNLLYSSALGLSPNDYEAIHNHLAQVGPDGFIIAGDFVEMDKHVSEEDLKCALYFWFEIRGLSPDSQHVKVDKFFPELGRADFVRYRLIQRLANFIYVYRARMIAMGKGHPSGSFLTSLINDAVQNLTWTTAFAKALDITPLEFETYSRKVFLGDDSLIAIPARWAHVDMNLVRQYMLDLGYPVSGEVKSEAPKLQPLWNKSWLSDYSFLSRRFFMRDDTVVAPLDPSRCRKIICFVDRKKDLANMPEQFLAFAAELERYVGVDEPEYSALLHEGNAVIRNVFGTDCFGLPKLTHIDRAERYAAYTRRGIAWSAEGGPGGDSVDTTSLGGNTPDAPTTFIEDVVTDTLTAQDTECESWRDAGMETENHLEAKVFCRPFNFATYSWTAGSTGLVHSSFHPSDYFRLNFNAQAKIANYSFLRGIMCIRAVMTSSPYTAGKLLMSVRPPLLPPSNVVVATGDPCVELDAASGKSATIKIPCVLPFGWSQVEKFAPAPSQAPNVYFDWCTFTLSVISALKDPALPTVTVQLYAWIEEPELKGPGFTNFTLSPQGGQDGVLVSSTSKNILGTMNKDYSDSAKSMSSSSSTPVPSESGVMKVVHGAHKVVKTIGGILVDSAVMVAHGVALAALVGLSDPSMLDNTTIVANIPHFDAPHMYGKSPALVMAADQACKIVLPYGSFSVKSDCMNIRKYASRMALLGTVPWSVVTLSGTQLGSLIINPAVISSFNTVVGTPSGYTPLAFASSMFRFWRGSIRYRLALAKTRFHAGIIEIVWQMGANRATLTDDAHATICYRAIWDIQESESFELTVPYASPLPWTPTFATVFRSPLVPQDTDQRMTGFLRLRVVSPLLSSNDLASDIIDIVVYTAGGPDLEFAFPCPPGSNLFNVAPAPIVPEPKGKEKFRFHAEGGGNPGVFQEDKSDGLESVNSSFVLAPVNRMSDLALTACIGESIINFRPLLRRFGRPTTRYTSDHNFYINNLLWSTSNDSGQVYFTLMAATFAFCTGGFRVAIYAESNAVVRIRYFNLPLCGLPVVRTTPLIERVFGVPYHSIVPFIFVRSLGILNAFPLSLQVFGGSGFDLTSSLATADDFSFGWQIGPDIELIAPGRTILDDDVLNLGPVYT